MSNKRDYLVIDPLTCDGERYRPGATVSLVPEEAARLLGMRHPAIADPDAVAADEITPPATGKDGNGGTDAPPLSDEDWLANAASLLPQEGEVTQAQIIEAIGLLIDGREGHWTAGGKPDAKVLSAMLGRKVAGADRDAAWELVLAERVAAAQAQND